MKKLCMMVMVFALIAAMFAGCRRNGDTTAPGTTAPVNTTQSPAPQTTTTRPSGSTTPHSTDLMPETPDGSDGGGYARRMLPPRY